MELKIATSLKFNQKLHITSKLLLLLCTPYGLQYRP